jgi:HlyD family secretion protein
MKNSSRVNALFGALALFAAGGCKPHAPASWQGYLEGEFIHVASPLGGRLDQLAVQKGTWIAAGAPLFVLEHASELAVQRETADRHRAAQARFEDLRKGSRPTELAALEARVQQARSAAELSQRERDRLDALFTSGAIAANDFDRARLTHERNTRAVEELAAQLATARLGGRSDALAAAESEVAAAAATKDRADWTVAQKAQAAPRAALVYDTLFREGEFVPAGTPVLTLLPPENLKVRFFVPEAQFAQLKPGDRVLVSITGRSNAIEGRVNYLSPRPEYTPPILYNRDNRAKLVFLVEAAIDPAVARELHPGQPVDVTLRP